MTNVLDFAHAKAAGRRISMVAAYDAWSAALIARSNVDAILVGDSAAMVLHGHPTTLAATGTSDYVGVAGNENGLPWASRRCVVASQGHEPRTKGL